MAQGCRLKALGKVCCLQPPASSLQPNGFTFVELLIAATMLSVLFIGLGSHLRGGIIVWRQTTRTVETLQRERVAWDRLERDLTNAIVYEDTRGDFPLPPMTFGQNELRWMTVQQSRQSGNAIRLVSYRCAPEGETQGLWRTSQSVGEARSGVQPSRELVLAGCKALGLRYAYVPAEGTAATIEWLDEWRYPKELPQLIKVTVHLKSGRDVQRCIAIPQGSFKRAEESSS